MSSISVCMMVQNAEKTLAIALESLGYIYDQLIIVDGGSNDSTCDIALSYGAQVIHSKWTGNHSDQRNVYLKYVQNEWIFVLDSDEFISTQTLNFIQDIKSGKSKLTVDNFWLPRKWIAPLSLNKYIISKPHYPDLQRRLFKYNSNILYTGQIHESIQNLNDQGKCLPELGIYHLDLFINNEEKRKQKVRKYSRLDPRDGGRHYYLPDKQKLETKEWKYEELSPSIIRLLENLLNSKIKNSELNLVIPPEIKNDSFYYAIQQIVSKENIKNVLEIGSSSGGGSTEAFVTGLRENAHSPKLFCMEVSKTRFAELAKRYNNDDFVKCYNVSSISLEAFPNKKEVIDFYNNTQSNLKLYPLEQVLGWLEQDIEYIINSGVTNDGIKKIKRENNIELFDLVLIDGSEFTGIAELDQVYGAKFICLDDINTFKNYKNHRELLSDINYELVVQNSSVRNGFSIFRRIDDSEKIFINRKPDSSNLPIHFFTIVLNGQPFIRYHINVFQQLPFNWHWHIVEGVADLKHDTSWSVPQGGCIADEIHSLGRSIDGTSEYIDELAQLYPDNITIYRKPEGVFWEGKREMVNEPLFNIQEECLLWQIDADELWTVKQLCSARQMFVDNPHKTAAFYWCWYFVGEDLVISTRNCYAQNPQQEWLRTWRFKPGAVWVAHEPPKLQKQLSNGQWIDVASINPFTHSETEERGLIFQHFAYTTKEQLKFKEEYYGYKGAVSQWTNLQQQTKFPVLLRDYFAWVGDDTTVDKVKSYGIVPIAQPEHNSDNWRFLQPEEIDKKVAIFNKPVPIILIDGVFFQLYETGIARVWKSLLEEWSTNDFAKHIIVLDRAGTAPKIAGIRYRQIPQYDYNNTDTDREMLQQVCDEEGADLFISSYYTTPITTPSVFMAHDMIPELMGWDLNNPMWREKHYGIQHASAYIAVSENTARDLVKCFPDLNSDSIAVAPLGVNNTFHPGQLEEVNVFKTKYGITKPYFLIVGASGGYKNSALFFKAFVQLASRNGFDIICTGSGGVLAPEWRTYTYGSTVHMLQLSDEELAITYSGAIALVYPSKYEGFGLPILEAMACGCPVITCANASIPEVAGDAAIYINDSDAEGLANALCEVQKPGIRQLLINRGIEQAKKFSWSSTAKSVTSVLINTTIAVLNLREINLIIFPDWTQPEEILGGELEKVIGTLAAHADSQDMTLLIDVSNSDGDYAEMLLSAVSMNLLMQDLDISEGLEISLVSQLGEMQWEALLPRVKARIVLECENKEQLIAVKAEKLNISELNSFHQLSII
ncbi:glycosyltransferase [Calothrix sp. CCY 0018]|uniref:glycosyltransferase n=1 Tax=Calothrix sp. CCY 0018 TaxID=3103864 RepID=UPI0039C610E4